MNEILEKAKQNMILKEKDLSPFACKSDEGVWLKEDVEDIRPIFYRDIDRIIHSSGYTRLIDKTQVYSFIQNDHITRRVLHVQLVSKIARTIGRSLALNEDLIEAMALGHDIGHTPFGHKGESLLNSICEKEGIGYFCHNAQSVRILQDIEGLNISMQTLDGILAHNGEILKNRYEHNIEKTKEEFAEDLFKAFHEKDYSRKIVPITIEGSVVRLSDVIAYIGRDIEDAITLGIIERNELPEFSRRVIGDNNSKIVDTLIKDVIINSLNKPYLSFSQNIFEALIELQEWNFQKIYNSEKANANYDKIEKLFTRLYYYYLEKLSEVNVKEELKKNTITSSEKVLYNFVNKMMEKPGEDIKRVIVDYIAGQTDKFFLNECEIYLE